MAGEFEEGRPTRIRGTIIAELASEGFADAREVGDGASGVVYRCHQTSLGRTVAIKVLASDLAEANRQRFLREGYAMGQLSGHPNIVNILQVGVTASNRPYIVMPYHRADSLALRMRRSGPIPWPDVLRIGVKLCGALETAHKAGTLHRDIKPGNVLVTDYGEPQLSDFGIARIVGGYQTVTGFVSGTFAFTAPEVLSGHQPTVAADVYSLGATLYELIAGAAAHEHGSGVDLIAQYLRIASAPPPDLRPGGIPDDVCTAIEKAMSLDPADRPASAADFGLELQAAQRHNGLPPDSMALPNVTGEDSEDIPAAVINVPDRHGYPAKAQSAPPVSTPSSPSSNPEPPAMSAPPVPHVDAFPRTPRTPAGCRRGAHRRSTRRVIRARDGFHRGYRARRHPSRRLGLRRPDPGRRGRSGYGSLH